MAQTSFFSSNASLPSCSSSEQTTVFKIFFDDNVCDSIEHNLDILRICGAGHVGIDLLNSFLHVQVLELKLNVVAGIIVRVGTC